MHGTTIDELAGSKSAATENATLRALRAAGASEQAAKISVDKAREVALLSKNLEGKLVLVDEKVRVTIEAAQTTTEFAQEIAQTKVSVEESADQARRNAEVYSDVQMALIRNATALIRTQALLAEWQGRQVTVTPVEYGGTGVTLSTGGGAVVLNQSPELEIPTLMGGHALGLQTLSLKNAGSGEYNTILRYSGSLTDNRQLTLNLLDSNRTLTMAGNLAVSADAVVSGTNTGDQDLSGYQTALVSGTSIKTINGASLLGAGNINTITQVPVVFAFAVSDEVTALTAGTNKITLHWLHQNVTITEIQAGLSTVQTSGSRLTIDVKKNGVSMFSTLLSFDNAEDTTLTSSILPVLASTAIAKGDKITVDITQIGDGSAKGLKIYVMGTYTPS